MDLDLSDDGSSPLSVTQPERQSETPFGGPPGFPTTPHKRPITRSMIQKARDTASGHPPTPAHHRKPAEFDFLVALPEVVLSTLLEHLAHDLVSVLRLAGTSRFMHATVFCHNPWLWWKLDTSTLQFGVARRLRDVNLDRLLEACDPDGTTVRQLSLQQCTAITGTGLQPFLHRTTAITSLDLRFAPRGTSYGTLLNPITAAVCQSLHRAIDQAPSLTRIKFQPQRRLRYTGDIETVLSSYDEPCVSVLRRVLLRNDSHYKGFCIGCGDTVNGVDEVVGDILDRIDGVQALTVTPLRVTTFVAKDPACSLCHGVSCNQDHFMHPDQQNKCPRIFECSECDETYCTLCRAGGVCESCLASACNRCDERFECNFCGTVLCSGCSIECNRCTQIACPDNCFEGDYCSWCDEWICFDCGVVEYCSGCDAAWCLEHENIFQCSECGDSYCELCGSFNNCAHCNATLCQFCTDECPNCGDPCCDECANAK